ncbi:MAG: glycosyltransferase family 2 protein [Verrucomicrobiota bacterium]
MDSPPILSTELSIVIPIYNELESIPALRAELAVVLSQTRLACVEIICVDDGSTDGSDALLKAWAQEDPQVHVLIFSRNFGQQAAITAGLEHCQGERVVIMDADLQDPPELILEMLEKSRQGFDMVYARRQNREGESRFKKASAYLFYRLMRAVIGLDLPEDTGDFRLMNRRCLEAFLSMREQNRFLRGMFHWVGFRQTEVLFSRPPRQSGYTKYPFSKMLSLSINAALSFSTLPLRLILMLGCGVSLFGAGYAIYSILWHLITGDTVKGWTTLIVLITLIGGSTLICLGIIGEYVSRIYDEVKGRPQYLLREIIAPATRKSAE